MEKYAKYIDDDEEKGKQIIDDTVDVTLSHVQVKDGHEWKLKGMNEIGDGDVFMMGMTEYIAVKDAHYSLEEEWMVQAREYAIRFSYRIDMERAPNGSWSAKTMIEGTPYLGKGNNEREALAELVLAMGLIDEIRTIEKMAPDHDLHG